jgi:hypothetical protein
LASSPDGDSRATWLYDKENDHERKPASNFFAEIAVKKLFLFAMHSLNLDLGMMLFLLAEAWPFKPDIQSINTYRFRINIFFAGSVLLTIT